MKDRFLFRGKRKDFENFPENNWWIEGDVSHHKTGKVFIKKRFGDALSSVEIIPETLSQYVGHCDIHGNKVWENNIVKETFKNGEVYFAPVIYSETFAGFMVEDESGCLYHMDFENDKWEVIGNVFDNPEILMNEHSLSPLEKAIKKGLETGVVKIKDDFSDAFGCAEIYCDIKGFEFYFEKNFEKRLMSKEKYMSEYSFNMIAKSIASTLSDKENWKEYDITKEDYNYCMFHLDMPEMENEQEKERD